MIRIFIVVLLVLIVAGCSETPAETHRRITSQEATVSTFEELKASYSKRKQAQMDSELSSQAQLSGKSKEQIMAASLKLFRRFADCKRLKLVGEEVNGSRAILTYENSDTCFSKEPNVNREIVHMVNENGWKIDEIEIKP
jgi:hypothetical protein